MSTTSIDHRMAQVLAEMSVLAEASTARVGDVVHGGEHDRAPRGARATLADQHAERYLAASTPAERRLALENARGALIRARVAPCRRYVSGTLEWRIAIARAEGSVEQVSIVFGCSRQQVYRLREQLGPR